MSDNIGLAFATSGLHEGTHFALLTMLAAALSKQLSCMSSCEAE